MAELATAGSVVGLISLCIQACHGLSSCYASWRSHDKDISQIYRDIDELRVTCENLEHELQKYTHERESAMQQVVRLIASCRSGIESLGNAAKKNNTRNSDKLETISGKMKLLRIKSLYPFTKRELIELRETVRSTRDNLRDALQTLQLYVKDCGWSLRTKS